MVGVFVLFIPHTVKWFNRRELNSSNKSPSQQCLCVSLCVGVDGCVHVVAAIKHSPAHSAAAVAAVRLPIWVKSPSSPPRATSTPPPRLLPSLSLSCPLTRSLSLSPSLFLLSSLSAFSLCLFHFLFSLFLLPPSLFLFCPFLLSPLALSKGVFA